MLMPPITTPTSTLNMLPAPPPITHIEEQNCKQPLVSPRASAPGIPFVERTSIGYTLSTIETTTKQTNTSTSTNNTPQPIQPPPLPIEPHNPPTLSKTYGNTLTLNNNVIHIRVYCINIHGISASENYAEG